MPHTLLLYVFLLRIPWGNRDVVPDCTVTAKQRDRHGFQTQLTHGFGGVEGAAQLCKQATVVSCSIHKNIPTLKVSRACFPVLEGSSTGSWEVTALLYGPPPLLPTRQGLRAVPAVQLLLLHHPEPFTPQCISKVTN